MRLVTPIIFGGAFIVWLVYHGVIKKDIRQHWGDLGFGVFFLGVWALLYWLIFS